jgi:hypothetical protein
MTRRHDASSPGLQILPWIGTLPFGAPGRGGSVYGDGPAHSAGRVVGMREQIEFGSESGPGQGSIGIGQPGLRLLPPWVPDEARTAAQDRGWPDGPTGLARDPGRLDLAGATERELARPSAMIVMQQILRAWRSAERQLDATFEGSPDRRQMLTQIATLRALYQGLFAQVRQGLAERAPF